MSMQAKEAPLSPARAGNGRDAAKAVFAVGGLLAAFGVASCCALPVVLSLLGISAASVVGIGYLAAQYQHELFYVSAGSLGVAALLLLRQRGGQACAAGGARSRSVSNWGSVLVILLAVALLALTFWVESPL
jgi:mercuric ion transport protein